MNKTTFSNVMLMSVITATFFGLSVSVVRSHRGSHLAWCHPRVSQPRIAEQSLMRPSLSSSIVPVFQQAIHQQSGMTKLASPTIRKYKHTPPHKMHPVRSQLLPEHTLLLNSSGRLYFYRFQGRVHCGDSLCENPSIQFRMVDVNNHMLEFPIKVQSDGSYAALVHVLGYENDQVDWKLSVRNGSSQPTDVDGRAILISEKGKTYTHDITLKTH